MLERGLLPLTEPPIERRFIITRPFSPEAYTIIQAASTNPKTSITCILTRRGETVFRTSYPYSLAQQKRSRALLLVITDVLQSDIVVVKERR